MKRIVVAILLIVCLSGCTETIKSPNPTDNQFIISEDYDGDFGQDWLDAVDNSTKYPGNVHGYYENNILYPVEYNIYFVDDDYWITITGENPPDKTKQLMEVPAWIYLNKEDDKYIVTALVCEFDKMVTVG